MGDEVRCRLVEMRVKRGSTQVEDHKRLRQHLENCEDASYTAVSLIKKVIQGLLDEVPDMSEAVVLMKKFELERNACVLLRNIVQKRVEDLEAAMAQVRGLLKVASSPSAQLLEFSDRIL